VAAWYSTTSPSRRNSFQLSCAAPGSTATAVQTLFAQRVTPGDFRSTIPSGKLAVVFCVKSISPSAGSVIYAHLDLPFSLRGFFHPIKGKFQNSHIGDLRRGKTGQFVPFHLTHTLARDIKSTRQKL
jgi:hypothetical protein